MSDCTGGPFPFDAPVEAPTAESVLLVRTGGRLDASTGVPRDTSGRTSHLPAIQ